MKRVTRAHVIILMWAFTRRMVLVNAKWMVEMRFDCRKPLLKYFVMDFGSRAVSSYALDAELANFLYSAILVKNHLKGKWRKYYSCLNKVCYFNLKYYFFILCLQLVSEWKILHIATGRHSYSESKHCLYGLLLCLIPRAEYSSIDLFSSVCYTSSASFTTSKYGVP